MRTGINTSCEYDNGREYKHMISVFIEQKCQLTVAVLRLFLRWFVFSVGWSQGKGCRHRSSIPWSRTQYHQKETVTGLISMVEQQSKQGGGSRNS